MKRGVRESEVFLLFLSGRKETGGQPDLNGQYEGPFTRWFCQEEMTTAHEVGLRCIGVMESDERFGKPDFEQEKARSLTGGKGGKPIHERARMNARMLNDICFIPFRRQQHEMQAMVDEIVRQQTCAPFLQMSDESGDVELEPTTWLRARTERHVNNVAVVRLVQRVIYDLKERRLSPLHQPQPQLDR